VDAGLLEVMAAENAICKYVDMPVQHSEGRILRAMGRPGDSAGHMDKINLIRSIMPSAALRTSVIVGFPGETEEEFSGLLSFLEEARFDWVGVFRYSPEEGTPAAAMEGHVEEEVKDERIEELLEQQAGISAELNKRHVGRVMRVLVDEAEPERSLARTEHQAPDIDGLTIVNAQGLVPGQFMDVRIAASHEFDLEAEPL
jgi:ribosomal protein S12 methylthiotransferase